MLSVDAHFNDQISIVRAVPKCCPDWVFRLSAQSGPLTGFTATIDTPGVNIPVICRLSGSLHPVIEESGDQRSVTNIRPPPGCPAGSRRPRSQRSAPVRSASLIRCLPVPSLRPEPASPEGNAQTRQALLQTKRMFTGRAQWCVP